jgi:prepilin-type N-terminal cleavage/methylation domain-containing protein
MKRAVSRRRTGPAAGFTIPELVIALAVFSLVMMGIASATVLIGSLSRNATDQADFGVQLRHTEARLGYDARIARSFEIPQADTLRIHLPGGQMVEYRVLQAGADKILQRDDGAASRVMLRNVRSARFTLEGTDARLLGVQVLLHRDLARGNASTRIANMRFTRRN